MMDKQKKEPALGKETALKKSSHQLNNINNLFKIITNNNNDNQKGSPGDKENQKVTVSIAPGTNLNQLDKPESGLTIENFYAYAPENRFICIPTGDLWPAHSVDVRFPKVEYLVEGKTQRLKPSEWLAQNRSVEQMAWYPGLPQIINDRLVKDGAIIEKEGYTTYNLYSPPIINPGNSKKAELWIKHIRKVYGQEAEHLINWFAHRVQNPGEKINHAIVMGGAQGIGKDTIIEPLKKAVGPWNFADVTPGQMTGRFNGFVKSVVLRVSEARDMGEQNRFAFYEHLKNYTAAPPDTFLCDEKNKKEYQVLNVTGVIITTNYKTGGLYLPENDRRHFVAWSEKTKEDFSDQHWSEIYSFYKNGGHEDVAAYLMKRDLSNFDPKAPPPKTNAFYDIVDANRAPEDAEMKDALEKLGNPKAVTKNMITRISDPDFEYWLKDRKNRRQVPYRFEAVGYTRYRNPDSKDGLLKIKGKREAVYVLADIPESEHKKVVDDLKNKAYQTTNQDTPF